MREKRTERRNIGISPKSFKLLEECQSLTGMSKITLVELMILRARQELKEGRALLPREEVAK